MYLLYIYLFYVNRYIFIIKIKLIKVVNMYNELLYFFLVNASISDQDEPSSSSCNSRARRSLFKVIETASDVLSMNL